MQNTIHRSHRRPADNRYNHVHYDHCPAHCRYCGPDAVAWGIGEIVVGLLTAIVAVAAWLVRRPGVVLALATAAVAVWAVVGPS